MGYFSSDKSSKEKVAKLLNDIYLQKGFQTIIDIPEEETAPNDLYITAQTSTQRRIAAIELKERAENIAYNYGGQNQEGMILEQKKIDNLHKAYTESGYSQVYINYYPYENFCAIWNLDSNLTMGTTENFFSRTTVVNTGRTLKTKPTVFYKDALLFTLNGERINDVEEHLKQFNPDKYVITRNGGKIKNKDYEHSWKTRTYSHNTKDS